VVEPGIDRFGLHVEPSDNALCVETNVPRRATTLQRGDTAPPIRATLYDAEGNPVNLVGATVAFFMRRVRQRTLKIDSAPVTVVSPTEGQVSYAWQAGDTNEPGVYEARFAVTYPGGEVESFPNWRWHEVTIKP